MKAVFVFCEGNHDVTFIVRSLGQVADATWVGSPIRELPSPLGPILDPGNPNKPKLESLIARRYSSRTLDDLHLKAAAHAPVPAFEAIVKSGDTLYVLIRCHGDDAAQAAIDLLSDVNALLHPAYGTDVREIAAAFVFDADDSLPAREAAFALDYAALLDGQPPPTHGNWVKGSHCVGLYVFHDQASKKGTLEELIAPLVEAEWSARWKEAGAYIENNAQPADPVSRKDSERLKAQINVTGQFLFPGDPMSVVISKQKGTTPGLCDNHFKGTESQAIVKFLTEAPW
ncbi:hypothetical protein IPC618_02660 [Pseudomonas aeruginosa]|uniref:DUF3226 domain-containing protein n=1 Tax=Pseudomonas aeruginosa TaxID=287 RepID=UPI000503C623|nr:DUF3226 domain-containing protein [Pseudomonas aeruginosa]EIU3602689.1 hypothetical protein [Pseudomonas aeruginosa]EIU3805581.1 hypothetical protein [Pseudomonas aeruginosa]EKQ5869387.1 hypothetical protein [Pseudomonas aeruginosa]EKQ6368559.1 hypothetical protein [Pseudomonas aeruginosa]EKU5530466.1 hypothetical protein [Pseudomonas aeruginosa]